MKGRVLFLLLVLFLRFLLGWLEVEKYLNNSSVSITGNIYNIYHSDSKCVIQIGRFFVDYRNDCKFSQGDRIKVSGRVNRGLIDSILGRLWLNSAELVNLPVSNEKLINKTRIGVFLKSVREKVVAKYFMFLPEPESGLVAGIVLGDKKDIGREFYEQMIKSGTVHIAVASGYNIMLVGGTVLSVCFWLMKRKRAVLVAIAAMLIYAFEAGGDPPVMRAVIMAGIIFIASCMGRKVISWWILLVTGWVMILVEPLLLVSVSFQLSIAASVGLMVIEPWVRSKFETGDERVSELLSSSGVLSSVSTMLMTMPIIWWNFSRVSLIGIVCNVLILPFVPVLMILGAGMQVLPQIFSWLTYTVAHWMVRVIQFFGS